MAVTCDANKPPFFFVSSWSCESFLSDKLLNGITEKVLWLMPVGINIGVYADESYLMHTVLRGTGKHPLHSVGNSARPLQPTVWSLGRTSQCSQISSSPSPLSNTNQAIQSEFQRSVHTSTEAFLISRTSI